MIVIFVVRFLKCNVIRYSLFLLSRDPNPKELICIKITPNIKEREQIAIAGL